MADVRAELDQMKEFIMRQEEEISRLKKTNRVVDEDNMSLGDEAVLGQRLYDIEMELSEQKRSTAKITKLCMAAINSLERIEEKPVLLDYEESSKENPDPVDPTIIKTLCQQMEALNKLLIKVDDDIEAVDQKAEEGLTECEKLTEKLGSMEKSNKDKSDSLLGEMKALLVSKTYATREDLSRSIKAIPTSLGKDDVSKMIRDSFADTSTRIINSPTILKKEDVAQMIDKATSNFVRTINVETSNCLQKVKDSEDFAVKEIEKLRKSEDLAKKEIEKLKKTIDENEKSFKKDLWQLREQTDKNTKEVSRTFTEQQIKINDTNSNYEILNKRLDSEIKNAIEMTKDTHKDENKSIDENKVNLRMERLGKELSLVKQKQTDQTQQYDNFALRQTSMEQQTSNILKSLDKQQKDVLKIATCENEIKKLEDKVKTTNSLTAQLKNEFNQKADKNDVEEVKNALEKEKSEVKVALVALDKEKSKVTYFQDKISNIAKSVDGVKIEINNMRDKFCADIDNHEETIKSFSTTVKSQEKIIADNSQALKGITNESIGKLKEMANNCMQVETNIRSIRDKSILFDNDIKLIKDQLVNLKRDKSKSRPPSSDAEFLRQIKLKDDEIKGINEMVNNLKKKVQTTSAEVNNIKEDKRTKDLETEERQASLEQLLSDVRGWVETMLNESNKQMSEVALEVENANVKITKCASDLGEVFVKHASSTGDMSFVKKNLEDKITEVKDYGSLQQRELLDKILDLRGSFVDNQTEFVEKLKIANESISSLREEINAKVDKLDTTMTRKLESRTREVSKSRATTEQTDVSKKYDSLKTDIENLRSDANQLVAENRDKFSKLNSEVASLKVNSEGNISSFKKMTEQLSKVETESSKIKEFQKISNENKVELQTIKKMNESLKQDFEANINKEKVNLINMIRANEEKSKKISSDIDDFKTFKDSIDKKIKLVQDTFESSLNEGLKSKSFTSSDVESKVMLLKKELDHLKTELKNADLEAFKNTVNNTNETHNKLISAVQKSVDLIICEKTILESQTAVMDSKLCDMIGERDIFENTMKDKMLKINQLHEEESQELLNLKLSIKQMEDKTKLLENLKSSVDEFGNTFSKLKGDLNEKYQQISLKLNNSHETLNSEMKSLKDLVSNESQSTQEQQKREFRDIAKSLQEKSDTNINKINEAFEMIHNHTKIIDNMNESITQVNRNYEFSDSQIQKVELKLTSCIDELSKLDLFVTAAEMKKLERAVNDKSNKYSMSEVDNKIESTKQELENVIRNMTGRIATLDESMKDFYSKLDNISDFNNFYNEVQALSSKVNQHKAKMIDLEANITMQERINTKLSEDMKKFNLGMNKLGSPIGKTNSSDVVNGENIDNASANKLKEELHELKSNFSKKVDFSDLNKLKGSFSEDTEKLEISLKELSGNLSSMKNNFESKYNVLDKKMDSSEVNKIQNAFKEELKNVHNKLETLMNKNTEITENLKSNTKKQDELSDFGSKMTLQALETKFFKKEEIRAIENNILASVSKLERNISNNETSTKEVSGKVTENEKKFIDLNEKYANLQSFKTKVEGKMSLWDKKADSDKLQNIEKSLNDQHVNLRKEFSSLEGSLKESNRNVPKTNIDENKIHDSISQFEKKLSAVDISCKENSKKENELTKKIAAVESDVKSQSTVGNSMKSKMESLSDEMNNFKNDLAATKVSVREIVESKDSNNMKNVTDNLEKNLKESIGKTENKFAIFESFRKETESKLSDFNKSSSKDTELQTQLKANHDEFKKLDAFTKDELKKTRKDIEYTLEKCDELQGKLQTNQKQNNEEENISLLTKQISNFESKLKGTVEDMVECKEKLSQVTSEVKVTKEQMENKFENTENNINSLNQNELKMNDSINQFQKETASKLEKIVNNSEKTDNLTSNAENKLNISIENIQKNVKGDISNVSEKISSIENSLQGIKQEVSKISQGQTDQENLALKKDLLNLDNIFKNEIKSLKSNIELTLNKQDDIKLQIDSKFVDKADSKKDDSIVQLEHKIKLLDKCCSDVADLSKKYDVLSTKSNLWDNKASKEDVAIAKSDLNNLIENMKRNSEILKEDIDIQKQEINSLNDVTKKLTSLQAETNQTDKNESISSALESRVTAGMAQLENKMAIFEASRKEMNNKLTDLSSKQQKLNEECGGISEVKQKLNSKSEIWDNKAEMKNIEVLLKSEIDKLKAGSNVETLKSDITAMNKKLQSNESELRTKMSGIEENIQKTLKENEAINKNMNEASNKAEKISQLETKISTFENKFDTELNSIKDTTKLDFFAKKEDLAKIAEQVKSLNSDNKSLELEKHINDLKNSFNEWKHASKPEMFAKKEELTQIVEQVKSLNTDNKASQLEKQATDLKNSFSEVKNKLEIEIKAVKSLANDTKSSLSTELKSQINSELSKVSDKFSNNKENNKDRDQLEVSIKKIEDSIDLEKEKLKNVENKLNCIHIESLLKKEDVSKIVDINAFIRKDEIPNFVKKSEMSDFVKKTETSDFIKKNETSDFVKKNETSDFVRKNEVSDFVKKDNHSSDIKQLKTHINEELSKVQKNYENVAKQKSDGVESQTPLKDLESKFITKEEFTILDINFSKLSELVEHQQSEVVRHNQDSSHQVEQIESDIKTLKTKIESSTKDSRQSEPNIAPSGISDMVKAIQAAVGNLESSMKQIKCDVPSRAELEKLQAAVEDSHKGRDGKMDLTSIEKQRRGWEEAREKAEEMSQIFDSLIITNDRPYVSCGLDNEVTEPGFLEFSQFELINKVTFDTDSNQFTLIEPGVYLLQMGATIEGGNLVAKLVSDDIGVDFMTIEGNKNPCFKCRSSVFTIDDDDQIAESLMVELVDNNGTECCVGTDFFFLLYKISEVANADPVDQL